MKKVHTKRIVSAVLIVVVGLIVIIFASRHASAPTQFPVYSANKNGMKVAATIFPLYDMVRVIGGDKVNPKLLLAEAEPLEALDRLYSREDQTSLAQQQTIFAVGHDFDNRNLTPAAIAKITVVDKNINFITASDATVSPYYWLSVTAAPQIASTIANKLSELDPSNAGYYAERLRNYQSQLIDLQRSIATTLASAPRQEIIVYGHDWSYFTRDFGLSIAAYQPAVRGESLSADEGAAISKVMKDKKINVVFSDILLSPAPILPLLTAKYAQLYNLDIMGGIEDRRSYIDLMKSNAQSIGDGLNNPY